jgi:MFS family permease
MQRGLGILGAAVGPLVTALVLWMTSNDVRSVFLWTAIPSGLAMVALLLFLRGAQGQANQEPLDDASTQPATRSAQFGVRFWYFVGISTIFTLGSTSEAFLLLQTAALNQRVIAVPLIYFGFTMVYALLAGPLGALGVRWGRLPVLISGYIVFGLVYVGWAVGTEAWNTWVLFPLYGVYAALTQGAGKAFAADLVPYESRGKALRWYLGITGLAAIPGGFIGGWLWSIAGPQAVFTFGAWAAAISVALIVAWLPWLRRGYANSVRRLTTASDSAAPV